MQGCISFLASQERKLEERVVKTELLLKLNCCEQWDFTTEMTLQRHPELVNVILTYLATYFYFNYRKGVELQRH